MRNLMITMSVLAILSWAMSTRLAAASEMQPFEVKNVSEGVYVHFGKHLDIDTGYQGDICNTSFVVGSRGVAVIDTGGSLKVGNELREAIRKVTPLPVLYVPALLLPKTRHTKVCGFYIKLSRSIHRLVSLRDTILHKHYFTLQKARLS